MGFKVLAVLLSFTGCLMPYLAARKQWLLASPLPHHWCWIAFALLQLLAVLVLSQVYLFIVSALLILMVVMCSWCALVLAAGHLQKRPVALSAMAMVLLTVIMVVG